MKLAWLFNGTMEAHHLLAAYLVVWVLQGGYVSWVLWQRFHLRASVRQSDALPSVTRERK